MRPLPTPDALFWLMVSGVPAGPFTPPQILAKLAAGELAPDSRACPLGGSDWLPLSRVPGVAPAGGAAATPAPALVPPPGPATVAEDPVPLAPFAHAVAPGASAPRPWPRVVFGIVLACGAAWLVYEVARPLTPREVCARLDAATTPAQAAPYCTLNLRPAMDAILSSPPSPDESGSEYTSEGDAPPDVGGRFVRFVGQFRDQEQQRVVQVEGVYHVVDAGAWKVDDIYLVALDRRPLAEPVSVARDYPLFTGAPAAAPAPPKSAANSGRAKSWYEERGAHVAAANGVRSWLGAGGGKWVGIALVGACAALAEFWQRVTRGGAPRGAA